jgi:hypothetical protein
MMLKPAKMIRFSSASNLSSASMVFFCALLSSVSISLFVRSMKLTHVASFSQYHFSVLLASGSSFLAIKSFKVSLYFKCGGVTLEVGLGGLVALGHLGS